MISDTLNTNKNTAKSSFNSANSLYFSAETSNWHDYGRRFYDSQIGRFVSEDLLASTFPWWTPYQYAGNTPIWAIDLDGLEPLYSTCDFYQALRQSETALHGSVNADKTMSSYQKGAADGAMTGLSFSFSATRLGKIGIAAASMKNFNTTRAAFEVLGIEMPMLIDAVSRTVGGEMKGSNILSMGLNEKGLNKAANLVDLFSDLKSILKGATKVNQDLIEGIVSGTNNATNVLEDNTNNTTTDDAVSGKSSSNNNSTIEASTKTSSMKNDKKDDKIIHK